MKDRDVTRPLFLVSAGFMSLAALFTFMGGDRVQACVDLVFVLVILHTLERT